MARQQSTKPLTLQLLDEMIKDSRYGNSKHPGHTDWVKLVTKGFNILYSDKGGDDRRGDLDWLRGDNYASSSSGSRTEFPDQPIPLSTSSRGSGVSTVSGSMSGAGGPVHVRAYVRYVNGQPVDVSEYDRTAPPAGEASSGAEAVQLGVSPENTPIDGSAINPLGPYADVASAADCDYQFALDNMRCRSLPNAVLRAQCWANAMDRYSACGAGRPLPPLFPR